jgi:hypothetical protein
MKTIASLAIATATGIALLAAAAAPASAGRAACAYQAVDTHNHIIVGYATARKGSTACKRARRECNRKVDRARKHGKFGRSHGCLKARLG